MGKYALSPYMACGHGCLYCDGRAERYWVEGDFERDIVVRGNLPDLLSAELPRLREPGFVSIGSGISDAYQPVERDERLTRNVAAVLAEHEHPVVLMTKSSLVLRDLDLWRCVNERTRFMLVMSLVHPDDGTRARFEPGASPVAERLETLGAFHAAGCATGVLAMPLLPGLTDSDETIARLYDLLAAIPVDFIMPGGLTLRPGRQKECYRDAIAVHRPALLPLYDRLYAENRPSGSPIDSYTRTLTARVRAHNRRVGIPEHVPHRIYHRLLPGYDEAQVLLHHMICAYEAAGTNTRRLRDATSRYLSWLTRRKASYNRHPSWDYAELTEEVIAPGSLEEIIANERLSAFLRHVLVDDRVFDPIALELLPADSDGS
ncbi:MAG: radical SAM protein [Spirochaetota bacterium]